MPEYSGTVIEAQVDYLTCSAHGEEASRNLEDYGRHLLEEEAARGNTKSPWFTMGYRGLHCGHIDTGRRDGYSTILRVSGHPADGVLTTALSAADHVTRLDVAVTWRAEPPNPYLGANAYSNADMFYQKHPRSALPSRTTDAAGGYSTYLGDRRSPYYARVYNKEAERLSRADGKLAEHYRACWRYEVEAHDARAMALAAALDGRDERRTMVQQWVYDWFTKRGIPPAFPETGADAYVEGFHRRSDDETNLRHLARNVAPTVRRLRGRGREDSLREALGFFTTAPSLRELQRILSDPRYRLERSVQGKDADEEAADANGC